MKTWLDIIGFGSGYYQINKKTLELRSLDRVVTHWRGGTRTIKGRIMRSAYASGYKVYCLVVDGVKKTIKEHRIIAQMFIANPCNKPEINHKNGVKDDNRIDNLEWVTSSENQLHAFKLGLQVGKSGKDNPMFGKYGALNPVYGMKLGLPPNAKLVLDTETGIYYDSIKEAEIAKNMKPHSLVPKLLYKRKTSFIYA